MPPLHRLFTKCFFGLLFMTAAVAHAVPYINSLSVTEGTAAGGTTVHIYGTDFGTPGSSSVQVLVGGNYCQNTLLVAVDEIQCQTPAGTPNTYVDVQVYVDGLASSNTLPFMYWHPIYPMQSGVVSADNLGNPVVMYSEGSAAGGDTLLISATGIVDYLGGMAYTQPSSLHVFVDGNECTQAKVDWSGNFTGWGYYPGDTISCTTPAGSPGVSSAIEVFIDGVQDALSQQCNGCGLSFEYLQRPRIQDTYLLAYDNLGAMMPVPAEGSAAGGDTLILTASNEFEAYTQWMPDAQPRSLKIMIGGKECLNPLLHGYDEIGNWFGRAGNVITCTTPAGMPGDYAHIQLFINGVQDEQSANCNNCGMVFDYLQRPSIGETQLLAYDSMGTMTPMPAEGSAAGGDTLILTANTYYNSSFEAYTHGMPDTQPRSLKVTVGGKECLSPVLHWHDEIGNWFGLAGNIITCTTPPGMPSDHPHIQLFINDVQDEQSANCNNCGMTFDYLQRPSIGETQLLAYDSMGTIMPAPAEGSAAGGDTLILTSSGYFEAYTHWMPDTQPHSLKVLVGGKECLNPVLHWEDEIGNLFGQPGNVITCTTPAGSAGMNPEIQLFIDGMQDEQSVNCNNCGLLFGYLQRPEINYAEVVALDNNGLPFFTGSASGSATGGDTLILRSDYSFQDYVHWMTNIQPRSLRVLVGGNDCGDPVLHWNDMYGNGDTITCTTPAGIPGSNAAIDVIINGITSITPSNQQFFYLQRPEIDNAEVVTLNSDGQPFFTGWAGGSASGGDTLVLRSNYGFQDYVHWMTNTQPRSLRVLVGGKDCADPVLHWNDRYGNGDTITCTTPAGMPGSDADIDVIVNGVQDEQSLMMNAQQFMYWMRPNINSVQRVVLEPISGMEMPESLLEGSAAGGTQLQLQMSHAFRPYYTPNWKVMIGNAPCTSVSYDEMMQRITCFTPAGSAGSTATIKVWQDDVAAEQNDPVMYEFQYRMLPQINALTPDHGFAGGGSTLSISGIAFGDLYSHVDVRVGNNLCANANVINPSTVECVLPRGVPDSTVAVTVTIDGASTPAPNALTFHYDAAPQLNTLTPDHGPLSGGNLLTIEGQNFGNFTEGFPLSTLLVMVGNKQCSNAVMMDETHISCTVPSSNLASSADVSVYIDGVAAGNKLPYSYSDTSFASISPANGPTSGGVPLSITGTDLGTPGQTNVAVKIGSKYCASPVLISSDEILCTLPAGAGADLTVMVYLNGQAKTTGLLFSYDAPVLTAISPDHGPASGGTRITLYGDNFSVGNMAVSIGGKNCPLVTQGTQSLQCTTPVSAVAGVQAVVLTVGGQASNSLGFEYSGKLSLNGFFAGSRLQESKAQQ